MTGIRPEGTRRGSFLVRGELVFGTVPDLLGQGGAMFDSAADGAVEVDLNEVTRADSAGVALLIEWMRTAHRRKRDIVFTNVPEQMLAIARVCGVDAILPLERKTGTD